MIAISQRQTISLCNELLICDTIIWSYINSLFNNLWPNYVTSIHDSFLIKFLWGFLKIDDFSNSIIPPTIISWYFMWEQFGQDLSWQENLILLLLWKIYIHLKKAAITPSCTSWKFQNIFILILQSALFLSLKLVSGIHFLVQHCFIQQLIKLYKTF